MRKRERERWGRAGRPGRGREREGEGGRGREGWAPLVTSPLQFAHGARYYIDWLTRRELGRRKKPAFYAASNLG